jgi:hypothetical protein
MACLETEDEKADLNTLKNTAESIVRAEVDALGYLLGRGYDVEITSTQDEHGHQVVFGVGVAELELSRDRRPVGPEGLLPLVFSSRFQLPLRLALGDLREAVRSPLDSGFFAYRAAESIMQAFRTNDDGEDRGPGWERMRAALKIDRADLDALRKFRDPRSHGEAIQLTSVEGASILRRAWAVVDAFVSYASEHPT